MNHPSVAESAHFSACSARGIVKIGHRKKMQYKRLHPSPALRDVVESVWVQHADKPTAPRRPSWVVPTGTVELLFHYGDPVAHLHDGGRKTMPRSYVTGQRTRPVQVMGTGRLGIVIVSLYPWGLAALFPGGADNPDGYVDLRLVDNSGEVARLEDRLREAAAATHRVQLVESYLLQRLRKTIDGRVAAACRTLANTRLPRPVRETSRALGVSERHLSRLFRSGIGLPPSTFARIMRFQSAIRMSRRTRQPWAAIAATCGYSDQAHLIHEVRGFAGRAPGKIVLDAHAGDSIFNGNGLSPFYDTVYL